MANVDRIRRLVSDLLYDGWSVENTGLLTATRALTYGVAAPRSGSGSRGKRDASPAPWNAAIGYLFADLHSGVRRDYYGLSQVTGGPGKLLAATPLKLTTAMLARLPDLIALIPDAAVRDAWIERVETELHQWARRARLILQEERANTKVRDADGRTMPRPVCESPLYIRNADAFEEAEVFCRQDESTWTVADLGWLESVRDLEVAQ